MKMEIWERTVRSWITTLFGVALLVLAVYFFWINIKEITMTQVIVGSVMGAVGFVFVFVKDSLISGLFKKKL